MMEDDPRVQFARVRLRLRKIEAEIARIRRESHFYQQIGFGREIKNIALLALEDERARRLSEVAELKKQLRLHNSPRPADNSWLLTPFLFLAALFAPRPSINRGHARAGAVPIRLHGLSRVNVDL
ncbi:MAG: hypothetical protein HY675_20015 [Chloroflexi bacterium]|nr:hypothetical protein [Chloroflexota bacterium]